MSDGLDPLICDFLEWLAPGPRPYAEVMEAWRTSCPRLTVWEDAIDRGFVARVAANAGRKIAITPAGRGARGAKSGGTGRDTKRRAALKRAALLAFVGEVGRARGGGRRD